MNPSQTLDSLPPATFATWDCCSEPAEVLHSRATKCAKSKIYFVSPFVAGEGYGIGRPTHTRAQFLATIAAETIEKSVRNVAILDYYLKHVSDESQLRLLDRWLAEEVLSAVFGGHKKGHFRRIGFRQLRAMGLPSLLHRRRMICSGRIEAPFFVWKREKATRAFKGTVARLCRSADRTAFSPFPEAAASKRP